MIDPASLATPARVAALLGVPESRLARWRSKGVGPAYVKIEGRVAYPLQMVVDFLNDSLVQTRRHEALTHPDFQ